MAKRDVADDRQSGGSCKSGSSRPAALARSLAGVAKRNATASIAAVAALVTMAFVPPDTGYLEYFDINTLACLFALLAVIRAFRNVGLFDVVARAAIGQFHTLRGLGSALVFLTMACSMFATNDMALLMLLPLSTVTLVSTGNERAIPFTFTMQAIAANLGGMILPFGNPQNIFLNARFHIAFPDFLATMALPFAVSVLLIALCCAVGFKPVPLETADATEKAAEQKPDQPARLRDLPRARTLLYAALFALSLGMVFHAVPAAVGAGAVLAALLAADRRALAQVDWGLLATFVLFFAFSGNMARIPAVQGFFQVLLDQSTLLTSALASQVISNVPAAILLAPFADGYQALLVGVNIGGAGTLIASLASLIAFNHFRAIRRGMRRPGVRALTTKRYLALFSALNFGFLAVLLAVCLAAGI